jgi:hypothetical protein
MLRLTLCFTIVMGLPLLYWSRRYLTSTHIKISKSTPTFVEGFPEFEYFASQPYWLDSIYPAKSNTTFVDDIVSQSQLDSLVPKENTRIEFEDLQGHEEVRVVNGITGDFWVAKGDIAKDLIARISASNDELYRPCFDDTSRIMLEGGAECEQPFWNHIIMYDYDARRIFPAIRHIGTIDNLPDMEAAVDHPEVSMGVWYTHLQSKDIVYVDRHTGDYWVGVGEVARILEERFDRNLREQNDKS